MGGSWCACATPGTANATTAPRTLTPIRRCFLTDDNPGQTLVPFCSFFKGPTFFRSAPRRRTLGRRWTLQRHAPFEPYLPRLVRDWAARTPAEPWRELDGSLVSVDLSGFTALAERLQAKGRAGAEELVLAISGVFEGLIGIANRRGGDVLKFRGDALLILFSGDAHAERACRAASEMQWFIERTGETMSSVGEVQLRMSTGIYSGTCHFFLVESSHRELMVAGPAATATIQLEDEAGAGEVLVSPATAAAVGPDWLAGERGGAALLALDREPDAAAPPIAEGSDRPDAAPELEPFVPVALRSHLRLEAGEAEHRQVTAAFLKFTGVEALLAQGGPAALGESLSSLGALVGDATSDLGVTWLESDIDVDGGKIYLAAGAPSSTGADEERMLRALRAVLDSDSALTLRAGVHRGPVFAGDIGASDRRSYAVMGDTVNLAARLAARAEPGQILATGEVLERSQTRFETAAAALPGQREGTGGHRLRRRRRHRRGRGGARAGAADRRPRERVGGPRGGRRCGAPATGPGRRARRRARDRQVAARRRAQDDGGRLHAARRALRPVRDVRPLPAVSLVAAPACGNHGRGKRGRGRRAPEALGRGRDARLCALAPAARDSLRRGSADDTGDRGHRAGLPARARLQDRRGVPAPRAHDADAHRLRGHALDRRRLARPPPPPRAQRRAPALAPGDHAPAPGLAFPRRAGERSQAARAFGAPRRSDCAARAGSGRRGRALRGAARSGLGALGRESALRARARQRLPRRRRSGGASGDGRDADHHPDRHARAGRSLPSSKRLGPRGPLRARPPGRCPRRRARGCRRPRPLAATRGVRGLGRDERAAVPARSLPDGRLRGPLLPPPSRDPRARRHRARAARRGGPRRARASALAPLPACGGLRAGLALLPRGRRAGPAPLRERRRRRAVPAGARGGRASRAAASRGGLRRRGAGRRLRARRAVRGSRRRLSPRARARRGRARPVAPDAQGGSPARASGELSGGARVVRPRDSRRSTARLQAATASRAVCSSSLRPPA